MSSCCDLEYNSIASLPSGVFSDLVQLSSIAGFCSPLRLLFLLCHASHVTPAVSITTESPQFRVISSPIPTPSRRCSPSLLFATGVLLCYWDMHCNSITSIPSGFFSGLSSLVTLCVRVKSSCLMVVAGDLFILSCIKLHYNRIKKLPSAAFADLGLLEYLYAFVSSPSGVLVPPSVFCLPQLQLSRQDP